MEIAATSAHHQKESVASVGGCAPTACLLLQEGAELLIASLAVHFYKMCFISKLFCIELYSQGV